MDAITVLHGAQYSKQLKGRVAVSDLNNYIIRIFGLKGSWKWACNKMLQGCIVRRSTDTGAAHYKLDNTNNQLIKWAYTHSPFIEKRWDNANIFLSDFTCTKWVVVEC